MQKNTLTRYACDLYLEKMTINSVFDNVVDYAEFQ